ncbi:MAG: hypothetical protein OEZ68_01810 [Gammaproteobacteria bacterium]|nr:hypothetical protein [Gammaproteobacteria bacterium]MDH5799516.1 hypothetical protein [Gammaproteobacteria bacterium]
MLRRLIILLLIMSLSACGGSDNSDKTDPGTNPGTNPGTDPGTPTGEPIVNQLRRIDVLENTTFVANYAQIVAGARSLSYSLDQGMPDSQWLAIDSASGVLSFITAPDFENPQDHNLDNVYLTKVTIVDGTVTETFDLDIRVINAATANTSNTAPRLVQFYSFEVDENVGGELGTVRATDLEENSISFSIGGGVDSGLAIDSNTGVMSFTAHNFEQPTDANGDNVYEFGLNVSDGELSTFYTVAVTVLNVNEAPVMLEPRPFVEHIEVEMGSPFVAQIVATDEDVNTQLSYSVCCGALTVSASGLVELSEMPSLNDINDNNYYRSTFHVSDGELRDSLYPTIHVSKTIADADTSFGELDSNTGLRKGYTARRIITFVEGQEEQANDVAVLPVSNNIVAVGISWNRQTNDQDMAIWQFTPQGELNTDLVTGFGPVHPTDNTKRLGYLTHHNAGGGQLWDRGYALAITSESKIVVVGSSYATSTPDHRGDAVVWRYTTNGDLDTGFGDPDPSSPGNRLGYVRFDSTLVNAKFATGKAVAIAADGSIIVAGNRDVIGNGNTDMMIWKYNPQGQLDTGFGDSVQGNRLGYVLLKDTDRANAPDWGNNDATHIALDSTGRILVAGTANLRAVVWRYTQSGELDVGNFGVNDANGVKTGFYHERDNPFSVTQNVGSVRATGLALTAEDKVVFACDSLLTGFSLVRLTQDGAIDTDPVSGFGYIDANSRAGYHYRYGSGGVYGNDYINDILILADGRIVLAGGTLVRGGIWNNEIWLFSADGLFQGIAGNHTTRNSDSARAIALGGNNKIVTAGYSGRIDGNTNTTVMQFVLRE